jgi:hypothetical protein
LIKKSSARIIALERDLNEAKLANDALRVAVTSLMRKVGDLPQDFPSIKQPPNGTGFDWEIDGEYLTRWEEEFDEGEEWLNTAFINELQHVLFGKYLLSGGAIGHSPVQGDNR